MRQTIVTVLLLSAGLALSGCSTTGAAVGAGAAVGVAAMQERGVRGAAEDTLLATKVRANLLSFDPLLAADIGVDAYEGRVLLAGGVADEETRAGVLAAAWKVDGVTDVINEVYLTGSGDFADFSQDSWITAKANTRLALDSDIHAINYSLTTHDRVLHVMGIARDTGEMDRVIGHLRDISGVRRVVNHARTIDPRANHAT